MRRLLWCLFGLIASATVAIAQGAQPLTRLVPVCADHAIVRAVYSGFGMTFPTGDRVYLQVCSDGVYGYQTRYNELRTGKLNAEQLQHLRETLSSNQTHSLRSNYDGGTWFDSSETLAISIWRGDHYQFIKTTNILRPNPAELWDLVRAFDRLRPEAGFALEQLDLP